MAEVCRCLCSEAAANCSMEPATEVLVENAVVGLAAASTDSNWAIELLPSQTDDCSEAGRRLFRFMFAKDQVLILVGCNLVEAQQTLFVFEKPKFPGYVGATTASVLRKSYFASPAAESPHEDSKAFSVSCSLDHDCLRIWISLLVDPGYMC